MAQHELFCHALVSLDAALKIYKYKLTLKALAIISQIRHRNDPPQLRVMAEEL